MTSSLRTTNLGKLRQQAFDVLIVGGGINGAVAAGPPTRPRGPGGRAWP
jgi:hypothetical protein